MMMMSFRWAQTITTRIPQTPTVVVRYKQRILQKVQKLEGFIFQSDHIWVLRVWIPAVQDCTTFTVIHLGSSANAKRTIQSRRVVRGDVANVSGNIRASQYKSYLCVLPQQNNLGNNVTIENPACIQILIPRAFKFITTLFVSVLLGTILSRYRNLIENLFALKVGFLFASAAIRLLSKYYILDQHLPQQCEFNLPARFVITPQVYQFSRSGRHDNGPFHISRCYIRNCSLVGIDMLRVATVQSELVLGQTSLW